MKLLKLIANLSYGSRKQVTEMFCAGRTTDANGEVQYADDQIDAASVRVDGEPLNPMPGVVIIMPA